MKGTSLNSNAHTFVVCAYGESDYLRDCVESLKAQTVETLLVMYTSTPNDAIVSVAHDFDIPLCIGSGKPGIANDWNRALACAETPYATIAHQDDVYLPSYTERMLGMMGAVKKPLIFFSDYGELRAESVNSENALLKTKRLLLSPLKDGRCCNSRFVRRRILSFGTPICCPSVTFNLETLPIPLFSDSMKCSLDWQAWERVSKLEGAFCYCSEMLMLHRIHAQSETSRLIADKTRTREDQEMLEKFWPRPIALAINSLYSKGQNSNNV